MKHLNIDKIDKIQLKIGKINKTQLQTDKKNNTHLKIDRSIDKTELRIDQMDNLKSG